jgi:methylenetetrahydrofolate reductase (NADPH)
MLKQALADRTFAITCEFVPGRGFDGPAVEAAVQFAKEIVAAGVTVHAISLTDNPGGGPAISPDVLAAEIIRAGGEPLVHFTSRDRNRNAMESRATALARVGVKNLLVLSGDCPIEGAYGGQAKPTFDLDSVQTVSLLSEMNRGLEVPGRKPGTTMRLTPTDFLIAAAVSPFKLTEAELLFQYIKMEKKIACGADLIISQLGYDMRKFLEIRRYLASRGLQTPVLGNVYVLSAGAGRTMKAGGVPGCVVTDALVARLEEEAKDPDKGKGKRLERAAKMVAMFKGMGFAGVHIGGFALKTEDFVTIIKRGEELAPRWEEFIPEVSFGRPDEFYAFPAPKTYQVSDHEADPVLALDRGRRPVTYVFMKLAHRFLFERRSLGHKVLAWYYKTIDKTPVMKDLSHAGEFAAKRVMFGCQDCGDCALLDLGYRCPMYNCAKECRNGPCGGSADGMCEKYPTEKPCAWVEIYRRLKSSGEIAAFRDKYIPPCRRDLARTSGWANYYLYRDHSAAGAGHDKPAETPKAPTAGAGSPPSGTAAKP